MDRLSAGALSGLGVANLLANWRSGRLRPSWPSCPAPPLIRSGGEIAARRGRQLGGVAGGWNARAHAPIAPERRSSTISVHHTIGSQRSRRRRRALPVQDLVLDGEAVVLDERGMPDMARLRASLAGGRGERFVCSPSTSFTSTASTCARTADRAQAAARRSADRGLGRDRYSDHLEGDGPTILAQACGMGLEGIVSKQRDPVVRGAVGVQETEACSEALDRREVLLFANVFAVDQVRLVLRHRVDEGEFVGVVPLAQAVPMAAAPSPSRLQRPAGAPRTVCGCQAVASTTRAIVAP